MCRRESWLWNRHAPSHNSPHRNFSTRFLPLPSLFLSRPLFFLSICRCTWPLLVLSHRFLLFCLPLFHSPPFLPAKWFFLFHALRLTPSPSLLLPLLTSVSSLNLLPIFSRTAPKMLLNTFFTLHHRSIIIEIYFIHFPPSPPIWGDPLSPHLGSA